jgi:hypothetical protein
MLSALAVVLLSFGAAGAQGVGVPIDDVRVVGAKNVTDGIDSLDVAGPIRVVVDDAAAPSVVVHAEKNLQPLVTVSASGSTLKVAVKGRPMSADGIVVTVRGFSLKRLAVHGPVVVDAAVTAGKGGAFAVTADGAARATLEGKIGTLTIKARGAVLVDTFGVSADEVNVDVAGAARVNVGPAGALVVRGGGVAKVVYRGNPKVDTNVAPTVKVTGARP